MITKEELMIGDLVRVNKDVSFKKGTIVVIRGIDADRTFHELKGCATCVASGDPYEMQGGVWLEFLDQIPLTDAILKANGFEYYHKNFASLNRRHPFQLEMVEWPNESGIGLWMVGRIIKIRYVHELQNAMKVCEVEKEIKLDD